MRCRSFSDLNEYHGNVLSLSTLESLNDCVSFVSLLKLYGCCTCIEKLVIKDKKSEKYNLVANFRSCANYMHTFLALINNYSNVSWAQLQYSLCLINWSSVIFAFLHRYSIINTLLVSFLWIRIGDMKKARFYRGLRFRDLNQLYLHCQTFFDNAVGHIIEFWQDCWLFDANKKKTKYYVLTASRYLKEFSLLSANRDKNDKTISGTTKRSMSRLADLCRQRNDQCHKW